MTLLMRDAWKLGGLGAVSRVGSVKIATVYERFSMATEAARLAGKAVRVSQETVQKIVSDATALIRLVRSFVAFPSGEEWGSSEQIISSATDSIGKAADFSERVTTPAPQPVARPVTKKPAGGVVVPPPDEVTKKPAGGVVVPPPDEAAYWTKREAEIRAGIAPADSTASRLLSRPAPRPAVPAAKPQDGAYAVLKPKPKPSPKDQPPGGGPLDTTTRDKILLELAARGGMTSPQVQSSGVSPGTVAAVAVAGLVGLVVVAVLVRPRS